MEGSRTLATCHKKGAILTAVAGGKGNARIFVFNINTNGKLSSIQYLAV